jgi:hypothetical protein
MFSRKLYRPSLKITRHAGPCRAGNFTFEVWSPFTGHYQVVASIEDGMRRVDQLADLIYQMWLQRHPKQNALADVPDTESTDTESTDTAKWGGSASMRRRTAATTRGGTIDQAGLGQPD